MPLRSLSIARGAGEHWCVYFQARLQSLTVIAPTEFGLAYCKTSILKIEENTPAGEFRSRDTSVAVPLVSGHRAVGNADSEML